MNKLQLSRFVWRFLTPLPVAWRAHQVGRSILSPFGALVPQVMREASAGGDFTMIDLGCGHGIFLALVSSELQKKNGIKPRLIGIDLAEDKIDLARRAFNGAGLEADLAVRDIADFDPGAADAITILDVLYLVPIDAWDSIFEKCFAALKPSGVLMVKEMNREKKIKFAILCLEETLAVKILRITKGGKFTFPTPAEIRGKLEKAGFVVEQEKPLDRGYHVPHMLWMARKPA